MKPGRMVGATLSPSEPAVSPLSGANAAIYTKALTRGSAPASVMTDPPQECPTRITSPPARSSALLVAATSSSRDVVGFCTEMTLYPLPTSGPITLFQQEPSAQSPWTKTIVSFAFLESPVCATACEPRNKTPANTKMPAATPTRPARRVSVIFFIVFLLPELVIDPDSARGSARHVGELRQVERLVPLEATSGEHFELRRDKLRPIEAPELNKNQTRETLELARVYARSAVRTKIPLELFAGIGDVGKRLRRAAGQRKITLGNAEESRHFAAGGSLAVQAMTIGDELGILVELEFDRATGALCRVFLGHTHLLLT